jgi:hypothetical protein
MSGQILGTVRGPQIEFSVRRGEGKREKREGERGKEREELLRLRSARQSGDRD